jgi:hypothetical protein
VVASRKVTRVRRDSINRSHMLIFPVFTCITLCLCLACLAWRVSSLALGLGARGSGGCAAVIRLTRTSTTARSGVEMKVRYLDFFFLAGSMRS